ncbi:hypothetical protein F2P81_021469 [Scophthalmus maximus]|uniref:Uncharacterized protein n=1 Tax=Scophthalmus maximus TaxID=52904 RepID=A0A6A4S632_SCOMX|nr:hypothetical protein F2P81_021469 [Scophthalmus maximus]
MRRLLLFIFLLLLHTELDIAALFSSVSCTRSSLSKRLILHQKSCGQRKAAELALTRKPTESEISCSFTVREKFANFPEMAEEIDWRRLVETSQSEREGIGEMRDSPNQIQPEAFQRENSLHQELWKLQRKFNNAISDYGLKISESGLRQKISRWNDLKKELERLQLPFHTDNHPPAAGHAAGLSPDGDQDVTALERERENLTTAPEQLGGESLTFRDLSERDSVKSTEKVTVRGQEGDTPMPQTSAQPVGLDCARQVLRAVFKQLSVCFEELKEEIAQKGAIELKTIQCVNTEVRETHDRRTQQIPEASEGQSVMLPKQVEDVLRSNETTSSSEQKIPQNGQKISECEQTTQRKDRTMSQREVQMLECVQVISQSGHTIAKCKQRIAECETIISRKDRMISQQEWIISEFEERMSECEQAISHNGQTISRNERIISQYEGKFSQMEQKISEYEQSISEYEQIISRKDQTIPRHGRTISEPEWEFLQPEGDNSEYEQTISQMEQRFFEDQQTLSRMEQKISTYEQNISEYDQIISRMDRMVSQHGWLIAEPEREMAQRGEKIWECERELRQRGEIIARKDRAIPQHGRVISEPEWEFLQPEEKISEYGQEISQREEKIWEHEHVVSQKEETISPH